MASLFISELTLLNIYIIKAEHVFPICVRKSYFRGFAQRVGIFFFVWTILKNIELQDEFQQLQKVNTRPQQSKNYAL